MEEDAGTKAPVTRLRRRLSVEQPEESKSPATNTPNKRRGRRAAKPDLELIEENVTVQTPKDVTTKKTVTKELIETIDEKPVTPSRRSARIRSNTSIISETPSVLDSPRAKRAARRISQVGSDNEAPITPARQTRRTRKESTSSIDKAENQVIEKQSNPLQEPITEENETVPRKSITKDDLNNTSRKSPRLLEKKERNSIEHKNSDDSTDLLESPKDSNKSVDNSKSKIKETTAADSPAQLSAENSPKAVNKNERFSIGSAVLLDNLNCEPRKKNSTLNKSTSALETINFKNKRSRTKSFTCVSDVTASDNVFYSDNERSKTRIKSSPTLINISGSGGGLLNKSGKKNKSLIIENDNGAINNKSVKENDLTLHDMNEQNNDEELNNTNNISQKAFNKNRSYVSDKETTKNMHTTTDSDTNSEKVCLRSEDDQCVPELGSIIECSKNKQDSFNESKKSKNASIISEANLPLNNSCEPMDIDETIPENILVQHVSTDNNNASIQNKSFNEKSKRKSIPQSLDNSASQSKSTLILSHLKDESNVTKSPQKLLDDNKRLSHSSALNITQENILNKKNITSCYSTSTPLQPKNNEKGDKGYGSSINPVLSESNTNKSESDAESSESEVIGRKAKHLKKNEKALASSDSQESDDQSSSEENNSLIDDGAQDAGEDYQSGDSQDEEEREYIANNEILERGETLSTDTSNEDESSNDSDYEKDSFIVSSDEEDDELLEGTEDDLSMSDNELNMTAKSKQKYNERKLKEQKKASREMFESRHKLNRSKNSSDSETKKKKERQISSSSETESDYDIKKTVKITNRKHRFDSSQDDSISNDSNKISGRRSRGISESTSNKSATSDNKIAISSDIANEASSENTSMAFINVNEETDKNLSIKIEEEQEDPIDAAQDNSSMSSDNEKIVQNYDSILQGLNNSNKKKNKVNNISLNQEVKPKKKEKHPLVDELNLTQVKSKKLKNKSKETAAKNETHTSKSNVEDDNSSSSDSDYLKLLFSEDSNNCEEFTNTNNVNIDDGFIPLKKSEGNTNILDKSGPSEGVELKFFIDTEGTNRCNTSMNNVQLNKSDEDDNSDSDAPMEILFKKEKNSTRVNRAVQETTDVNNMSVNKSVVKTPQSGKKKRQSMVEEDGEEMNVNNMSVNKSVVKTPPSGKKQRPSLLDDGEETNVNNMSVNKSVVKTPQSGKKKRQSMVEEDAEEKNVNKMSVNKSVVKTPQSAKKQRPSLLDDGEETNVNNMSVNKSVVKTPQSGKKKRQSIVEEDGEEKNVNNMSVNKSVVKTPPSGKKQRPSLLDDGEKTNVNNMSVNKSVVKTPQSGKKKRQSMVEENGEEMNIHNMSVNKSVVKTPQSGKKKRQSIVEEDVEEMNVNNMSVNKSVVKTPQSGKKQRPSLLDDGEETNVNNISVNKAVVKTPQSGKKQRQSIVEDPEEKNVNNMSVNKPVAKTPQSGKKKRQSIVEEDGEINNQSVSINKTVVKTPQSEKKTSTGEDTKITVEISTDNLTVNKIIKTPLIDKRKKKLQKYENVDDGELIITTESCLSNVKLGSNKTEKRIEESERNYQNVNSEQDQGQKQKRKRKLSTRVSEEATDSQDMRDVSQLIINEKKKPKLTKQPETNFELSKKNRNKKRKEREDDTDRTTTKACAEQSLKKIKVSRLPSSLLEQLDEKTRERPSTKANVTSTTGFIVEEIRRRKNKPSMYLEESIYLNENETEAKKYRVKKEKPKVLPFVPTASTSSTGYTTNFKVNVIKHDTAFVAKSSDINNFKNDHLYNKKIKRLGTYEVYKKSRNMKLSKF